MLPPLPVLGFLLLLLGAAGLIANCYAWLRAALEDRLVARLHGRRRALVYGSFAGVLAGSALVWATIA